MRVRYPIRKNTSTIQIVEVNHVRPEWCDIPQYPQELPVNQDRWFLSLKGNRICARPISKAATKKRYFFPAQDGYLYLHNTTRKAYAFFRPPSLEEWMTDNALDTIQGNPNREYSLHGGKQQTTSGTWVTLWTDGVIVIREDCKRAISSPLACPGAMKHEVHVSIEQATWTLIEHHMVNTTSNTNKRVLYTDQEDPTQLDLSPTHQGGVSQLERFLWRTTVWPHDRPFVVLKSQTWW